MNYTKKTVGSLLGLPAFNHYYQLPVSFWSKEARDAAGYIITFKKGLNLYVVDMTNDLGHTIHFSSASLFQEAELLTGIAAVPLAYLDTVQLLAYPQQLKDLNPDLYLKNLVALYQEDEEILPYLKRTKNYGDQVTRYQLEAQKLKKEGQTPDFFRYTSRSQVNEEESRLARVSSSDYDFIPDFHPFLRSKRGNSVLSLPALYQDPKTGESVKIDIMGWYIKEQQLKIRWKPKYMRKRRWRSSRISIDITSGDYFFQGQIYKTRKAPVFLKHLDLQSKLPKSYHGQVQGEYRNFLSRVEEQKRLALLRRVQLKMDD